MRSSRPANIVLAAVLLLAVTGVIWLYLAPNSGLQDGLSANTPKEAVTVRMEQISLVPFPDTIEALGTTQANKSVAITSEVASIITGIHFEQGEPVSAGEVLVTLEDAEARADLAAAQAALVDSRTQYKRSMRLSDSGAISESRLQQLEAQMNADAARVNAAQARLADHTIRAPFAGRTGLRQVSVGTLMQPGTTITTLDDINPIWLDFSVPEAFIGTLQTGQQVTAHSVAYPDRAFTGTVRGIDTRVDPQSRALTVRAAIDNSQDLLKPGMFLSVELLRERDKVLLIPEEAVLPEETRQYIFIVNDGVAHKREITTGRRKPGVVEVTSGLEAGEKIVVAGLLRVRDGVPVIPADTETTKPDAEAANVGSGQ